MLQYYFKDKLFTVPVNTFFFIFFALRDWQSHRTCVVINGLKYVNTSAPLNLASSANLPIAGFRYDGKCGLDNGCPATTDK